jgi:glycosyltransferase involved in cell wall biosynthesis
MMRLLYPLADRIVAVSTGVADDLSEIIGIPRPRIEVIYNPVVTPEVLALSQESIEHPWFQPGQPPVILGIGRLTKAKGFSALIHAFSAIRKNKLPARLIILGEGDERSKLEQLILQLSIETEVLLPGFHQNPYFFLRNSSVFVLSSLWEGLPTVLIEALACGTPIVSTDCPSGPCEILENGKWGTLVPVANENALVTAIQNTLTTPQRPTPEIAWARFRQEEVTLKYLRLVGSINYGKVR